MSAHIALLSDIHANLSALRAVLTDIDRRAARKPFHAVYCLGDLGGYAAGPNEIQALVMERGLPTILGNYISFREPISRLSTPIHPWRARRRRGGDYLFRSHPYRRGIWLSITNLNRRLTDSPHSHVPGRLLKGTR
jgi:hypothetical protein